MHQTSQNFGPSKILSSNSPPPPPTGKPQGPQAGAGSQTPALPDPGETFNQAGKTLKGWSEMIPFPTSYLLGPLGRSPEERKFHSLDFVVAGCQEIKSLWYREKRKHCEEPYVFAVSPLLMYHCITTCKMNQTNIWEDHASRQLYSSGWLTMPTADLSQHARIWWYVNPLQVVINNDKAKSYPGFWLCACICVNRILIIKFCFMVPCISILAFC